MFSDPRASVDSSGIYLTGAFSSVDLPLCRPLQASLAGACLPAAWLPWYWSVQVWFWAVIIAALLAAVPLSMMPSRVA